MVASAIPVARHSSVSPAGARRLQRTLARRVEMHAQPASSQLTDFGALKLDVTESSQVKSDPILRWLNECNYFVE